MSERRCPRCGGLVGDDAEWCGLCFGRLDEDAASPPRSEPRTEPEPRATPEPSAPDAPRPPAEGGDARRAIKVEGGRPLWTCPSCGTENPFEEDACRACGAPFSTLLQPEPEPPRTSPARAAALSLALPGLGHLVAGRVADGVARLVVFAYAVGTAALVLLGRGPLSSGPLLPLGWLAVASAAGVYVTSAIDAARAADGRDPLLRNRVLLYGAIGLMLLTVVVLVVSGLRIGSAR